MKILLVVLGIIGGIVLLFGLILMGTYNGLVSAKTEVETQRSQIETQLQRRFDLVPNLVQAVKGTMAQERAVFDRIAEAREKYAGTTPGSEERLEASNGFESALGRLLVVMENYPVLQSNETVRDLMTQLEGSENRVSVARQRYNESVQTYNRKVRTFPTNILAGILGFQEEPFFESVEGAKTPPSVNLEF